MADFLVELNSSKRGVVRDTTSQVLTEDEFVVAAATTESNIN